MIENFIIDANNDNKNSQKNISITQNTSLHRLGCSRKNLHNPNRWACFLTPPPLPPRFPEALDPLPPGFPR